MTAKRTAEVKRFFEQLPCIWGPVIVDGYVADDDTKTREQLANIVEQEIKGQVNWLPGLKPGCWGFWFNRPTWFPMPVIEVRP